MSSCFPRHFQSPWGSRWWGLWTCIHHVEVCFLHFRVDQHHRHHHRGQVPAPDSRHGCWGNNWFPLVSWWSSHGKWSYRFLLTKVQCQKHMLCWQHIRRMWSQQQRNHELCNIMTLCQNLLKKNVNIAWNQGLKFWREKKLTNSSKVKGFSKSLPEKISDPPLTTVCCQNRPGEFSHAPRKCYCPAPCHHDQKKRWCSFHFPSHQNLM